MVEKVEQQGFIIVNFTDGENDNVRMLFDLSYQKGKRLAKLYKKLCKTPKKKLFKIKL
jgi:hypothetical protein